MPKKYYSETSTCIRAIDLIRIANQILNDNMQFVQIFIVDSSNEDENGSVLIDAIPDIDSEDEKHYPAISSFNLIDPLAFGFRN